MSVFTCVLNAPIGWWCCRHVYLFRDASQLAVAAQRGKTCGCGRSVRALMICNKLLRDKADLRNFLTLHAKRCLEHFALKARTRYVIAQARLPHFKLGEPLLGGPRCARRCWKRNRRRPGSAMTAQRVVAHKFAEHRQVRPLARRRCCPAFWQRAVRCHRVPERRKRHAIVVRGLHHVAIAWLRQIARIRTQARVRQHMHTQRVAVVRLRQQMCHAFKVFRQPEIAIGQITDRVAFRCGQYLVTIRLAASFVFRKRDQPKPRVSRHCGFNNRQQRFRDAIADDDRFKVRMCLPAQRRKRVRNRRAVVESRQENSKKHARDALNTWQSMACVVCAPAQTHQPRIF